MSSVLGARARSLLVTELEGAPSPYELARGLEGQSYTALLESTQADGALGRYAFFGTNPEYAFAIERGVARAGPPGALSALHGAPLEELARLLRAFRRPSAWRPGLPPFLGGAVGYFAYELLHLLEEVPERAPSDSALADAAWFFYPVIVAADLVSRTSWCVASGFGDDEPAARADAASRHAAMVARVRRVPRGSAASSARHAPPGRRLTPADLAARGLTPALDREAYVGVVERARGAILEGRCFEICTANRYEGTLSASGLALYGALREVSPAPFSAYLQHDGIEIVSSSPERFLRVDRAREVETRPMKGTRPRGATPEEDAGLARELATDPKCAAENMMIVDLARNDLGRVCELGSVTVPELLRVETYPFTHQMISTVRGELLPGVDVVELLRAAFPGGSITGAPKIEAMKLIRRLEPVPRGVFSGSIGYIDFDGALDLNVAIRTFVKRGDALSFHVGGAVLADSVPLEEHQETLDKAHGLVVALERARAAQEAPG